MHGIVAEQVEVVEVGAAVQKREPAFSRATTVLRYLCMHKRLSFLVALLSGRFRKAEPDVTSAQWCGFATQQIRACKAAVLPILALWPRNCLHRCYHL